MNKIVNAAIAGLSLPGVSIVRTKEHAVKCVDLLYKHANRVHAWDTETVGVDIKNESPVGKG
jgi:hypothetical protein